MEKPKSFLVTRGPLGFSNGSKIKGLPQVRQPFETRYGVQQFSSDHFPLRKAGELATKYCELVRKDMENASAYARMGFSAAASTSFCAWASARSLPRVVK